MKKTDALFELIHSLTQSEKRYFKLYSSLMYPADEKRYVALFELIEKQKEYDEKKIKERLQLKFFAQEKRHLLLKVMECLRVYHGTHSVEGEMNAHLLEFRICLDKSLNGLSRKALYRAKKLAQEHERFTDIIHINKLETELLTAENNVSGLTQHIDELRKTIPGLVSKIDNQLAFEKEHLGFIKWNRITEFVRSKNEQVELDKSMQVTFLKDEKNAITFDSKIRYYYIHGLYNFLSGNFEKSAENFNKQFNCFEASPGFQKTEKMTYARAMANAILLSLHVKDTGRFKLLLSRLEALELNSTQLKEHVKYWLYIFRLMQYNQAGHFDKALVLIKNDSKEMEELEDRFTETQTMYVERNYVLFNTLSAYIGAGDPKKALKSLNLFLNQADADLKTDSYCMARIIYLFIHFELGNADLLEYNLKSTYRYLHDKQRLFRFERTVMNFIKSAIAINNKKSQVDVLKKLRDELIVLKKDPFEKNVFEYFDFISWLESRISGKSIGEVLKLKKVRE